MSVCSVLVGWPFRSRRQPVSSSRRSKSETPRHLAQRVLWMGAITLAGLPAVAGAQVLANPNSVRFPASADQNTVDGNGRPILSGYSIELFQSGASQPLRVLYVGK